VTLLHEKVASILDWFGITESLEIELYLINNQLFITIYSGENSNSYLPLLFKANSDTSNIESPEFSVNRGNIVITGHPDILTNLIKQCCNYMDSMID